MSLSIGMARANAYQQGFSIGGGMGGGRRMVAPVARRGRAGDPGLFGFLGDVVGGVVKTVAGAATGFISSGGNPLGAIAGGLSGAGILKARTPATTAGLPQINVQSIGPGDQLGSPGGCAGISWGGKCIGGSWGGGTAAVGVTDFGPAVTGGAGGGAVVYAPAQKKRRRMNPLNPRALSRSMRRVASFSRATRSIEKELGKLGRAHGPRRAPAPRGRGRASCSCK